MGDYIVGREGSMGETRRPEVPRLGKTVSLKEPYFTVYKWIDVNEKTGEVVQNNLTYLEAIKLLGQLNGLVKQPKHLSEHVRNYNRNYRRKQRGTFPGRYRGSYKKQTSQ